MRLPPEPEREDYETDEEYEEALDAYARAEHLAESRYMEDYYERKYGE